MKRRRKQPNGAYNDYLDALNKNAEVPPQVATAVLKDLDQHVRYEIRRRGLSQATPRLLGLTSHQWNDDAFEELRHDAFLDSFGKKRLRGLQNQRRAGADATGFVRRNIRNRITDLQREVDPIGYDIFERTCQAASLAAQNGHLKILNVPPPEAERGDVDGTSLLGFGSGYADEASDEELDHAVQKWGDDLFPAMVLAKTNSVKSLVREMADKIANMQSLGIEAFRLVALVDALKREIRRRWDSVTADSFGETVLEEFDDEAAILFVVRNVDKLDEGQQEEFLRHCIAQRIAQYKIEEKREPLWTAWRVIKSCVAEGIVRENWTKISRATDLDRRLLPKLYEILGHMFATCREQIRKPRVMKNEQRASSRHQYPENVTRLPIAGDGQHGR